MQTEIKEIELFRVRFNAVDEMIANSKTFQKCTEIFMTGIANEMASSAEKSLAYAEFLGQSTPKFIETAATTALNMGKAYQEELSAKEQLSHQAENGKALITKTKLETDLLQRQTNIVSISENTEKIKLKTAQCDLALKEKQIALANISIMSESQKVEILNKTAIDNLSVKTAEHLVEFLRIATSKNETTIKSSNIYTYILEKIDEIETKSPKLGLDTELLRKMVTDELAKNNIDFSIDIDANDYERPVPLSFMISNTKPDINETVQFSVFADSVNNNPSLIKYYINDELVGNGCSLMYKFSSKGIYKAKATLENDKNEIIAAREYQISVE